MAEPALDSQWRHSGLRVHRGKSLPKLMKAPMRAHGMCRTAKATFGDALSAVEISPICEFLETAKHMPVSFPGGRREYQHGVALVFRSTRAATKKSGTGTDRSCLSLIRNPVLAFALVFEPTLASLAFGFRFAHV